MDNHLGYSNHDPRGNNSSNTTLSPRRQKYFEGFNDKIIAMYTRGMSVRDMQSCLREIYGAESQR